MALPIAVRIDRAMVLLKLDLAKVLEYIVEKVVVEEHIQIVGSRGQLMSDLPQIGLGELKQGGNAQRFKGNYEYR